MSESLGYGALNEENPHTAIRDQIETMAKEANMELHEGQQHSDPVDAEGRSYLSDLLEKIDDLWRRAQGPAGPEEALRGRHRAVQPLYRPEGQRGRHSRLRPRQDPLRLPATEGYNKLMNNYGDDPYILFTPCNQTKAGYWGVYMTRGSTRWRPTASSRCSTLSRCMCPARLARPPRSSSTLKRTSRCQQERRGRQRPHCRPVAAKRRQGPAAVQHSLLLRGVYDLRRMAAVKGEHFFCVGWVPASEVDEVAGKARGIHGLRVTVDGPESAGKMTPPTKLKNPGGAALLSFSSKCTVCPPTARQMSPAL